MQLNTDLGQRAVEYSAIMPWRASPMAGVERRMLERDGEEVARATTVVRYAPGSYFDHHVHVGGEEFIVLDGVFSDEMGDFETGMYVRNPVGSAHRPYTIDGTTVLVKLQQFQPGDDDFVRLDTRNGGWQPSPHTGVDVLQLHVFGTERVAMYRFAPGAELRAQERPGGLEFFVVDGQVEDDHGSYPAGTWVRNPPGCVDGLRAPHGGRLFVKTGHLDHPNRKGLESGCVTRM